MQFPVGAPLKMKKQELLNAINQTAKDVGWQHWIETKDIVFVPMALTQLASTLWVIEFKENQNTKMIRKQLKNLWFKGSLEFED